MTNTELHTNHRLLPILGTVSVAVLAFILGYFVASHSNDETSSLPADQDLESTQSESEGRTKERSALSLGELLDSSQFSSRFARIGRTLEILAQADVFALSEYWEQAISIDTPHFQKEIQRSIIQRWSVFDPVEALSVVLKLPHQPHRYELIELIFLEWSYANIDQARDRALSLDQVSKEAAVAGMVVAQEHMSVSERREIARQLDCEWIAIEVLQNLISSPVIENPAEEWKDFIHEHSEDLPYLNVPQSKLLNYLVYAWVLQDGVKAIDSIRDDLPENFSLNSTADFVAGELMREEFRIALEFVVALANRESDKKFRELAVEVIGKWAESDARAALDATVAVEARSLRRELQKRVLEESAKIDAEALLSDLRDLPESLRHRAEEIALIEIAKRSPESVAAKLGDIDLREHRDRVAEAVAVHWGVRDIAGALHWINTDINVVHGRQNLTEAALRALTRKDPQLAFDTAVTLPLNAEGQGWEGRVIYDLLLVDTDSAIPMLPKARPGLTRRDAYDWAILMLLTWEQDVPLAMDVLTEMCAAEPKGTRYSTAFLASRAPRQVFDTLDRISSAKVQAELAESLIRENEHNGVFSDEELAVLKNIENSKPARGVSPKLHEAMEQYRQIKKEKPAGNG